MTSSAAVPLRFGILSTAKIGREHVIPAIQAAKGTTVLAIASRDGARAAATAEDLGIERSYGSYADLLADPEVDAVYNPLPNHLHAPLSISAMEAGKHVLCEKPLAMSADEATHMFRVADQHEVTLMEAFMYGFHPQWDRVFQMVRQGEIGEVVAVQSWFSYSGGDPDNIRNVLEWGGGGLYDIGCYCISVSRRVFGREPTSTRGILVREPGSGVDVVASGVLDFDTGQASFTVSTRAALYQRVQIVGTTGTLVVPVPFNPSRDQTPELLLTGSRFGRPERISCPAGDQYGLMASAFARAVSSGTASPVPAEESVSNMAVIDRLFADGSRH
ncbi:MAG: Gfo/Idh/MocA family oxidoreductase [Acidimicrobiia bacterium]|nr:Gfo/Idh/MocA family oxidoreductase [Acidimicrobiia bacterium]